MKTWMSALIAAALLCGFTATHAQERVLRVSTDGTYPPFSEINAKGEMTGFDIDIAKLLCNEMKVKCEIVQNEWDGLIPALKTRKIDAIIASMNATPERKKSVAFSEPYYQNPGRFVCKTGAPKEMKGKTLGVLRASIFDTYATEKLKNVVKIKRYNAQTDANLDMQANRVDLLFADSLVLEDGFLNRPEGKGFELCLDPVTDPKYFGEGIAIAVRLNEKKLADEFSAAIKAIRASGEYQKLSQQYFGRDIYKMAPEATEKK